MNNTWVKLYRKISEHEIIGDANALQLFIWILTNVNRTDGKVKTGRYWLAGILNMNPSTVYKGLKRLEKKYKVVTLASNNEYTVVSLLNWTKYQSGNSQGNNKVTTKEQQSNTIQEVENKELRKETSRESYLLELPEDDVNSFTKKFNCTTRQVIDKGEELSNYCKSKGKVYKDYKALLSNALRKDYSVRLNNYIAPIQDDPSISPEQAHANILRLRDMSKNIGKSMN